ncbi:hypothetical protein [Estrella lausannensis]|uniref:Putative secreted protein n=1 Tax=Estrella lausannensis TaxID=483423 RepID=A0A0H5DN00_9BACT|nr:hypothetical protein [Estrella lausannensis]CRX37412.1 putative secreted protein [Estrella lausannensis]
MRKILHKRPFRRLPFLLLEVMIAFGILALSAIPLVYPHLLILKEERALILELDVDLAAQNLIVDLLTELHENRVPFRLIEDEGIFEMNKEKISKAGITPEAIEKVFVRFTENHKPKPPKSSTLFYVKGTLHILYSPLYKERIRRNEATYTFSFLALRKVPEVSGRDEEFGGKDKEATDENQ